MGRGPKRYFAVLLFEIRHSRVTTLRSLGEKTHWQPFVSILGLHHSQALVMHLLSLPLPLPVSIRYSGSGYSRSPEPERAARGLFLEPEVRGGGAESP